MYIIIAYRNDLTRKKLDNESEKKLGGKKALDHETFTVSSRANHDPPRTSKA